MEKKINSDTKNLNTVEQMAAKCYKLLQSE